MNSNGQNITSFGYQQRGSGNDFEDSNHGNPSQERE
jgi:hypothetical protein